MSGEAPSIASRFWQTLIAWVVSLIVFAGIILLVVEFCGESSNHISPHHQGGNIS